MKKLKICHYHFSQEAIEPHPILGAKGNAVKTVVAPSNCCSAIYRNYKTVKSSDS